MTRRLFTVLAVLLIAPVAWACIWDKDTLDDERRGVPEGYKLVVTNRWHRHGEAYYRKRLETIPALLERNPADLGAYDDLAVAHERLGDRDKAIEVMDRKAAQLETTPDKDHLYRMHANRGTFHAHAGRFDEALAELDKAIEINPDAHFGREIYQMLAIRFVAAAKKDPTLWTKRNLLSYYGYTISTLTSGSTTHRYQIESMESGMTKELQKKRSSSRGKNWSKEALAGIAGMLRFGGLEGAELYRCMGDLYLSHDQRHLNLAWWSYRRAIDKGHPASDQIQKAIDSIEKHWKEAPLRNVPTWDDFVKMKKNGDAWLANFHAAEEEALARGEDPSDDKVLEALYAEADKRTDAVPKMKNSGFLKSIPLSAGGTVRYILLLAVTALLALAAILVLRALNKTRLDRTVGDVSVDS